MRDTLKVLGASNHSDAERSKLDYYGTDPISTRALLENETFTDKIWEPCAGHHLMVDELRSAGYKVFASDLVDYEGYDHTILDFFEFDGEWDYDIVTNPPYSMSTDFTVKALSILKPGRKLALFMRLQYLEGKSRYEKVFKDNPPKRIYVFINRQSASKVDDFSVSSTVAYCWFIWEKGFKGDPIIKWITTKN